MTANPFTTTMNTDHVFPQALQAGNLAQATGGLTLRDYFAAQALPAVTSDCLRVLEKEGFPDEKWRDGIANEAYKIADAMLKAREAAMTTQLPEALPALIERLRLLPIDHAPDGWPAVRTREITALLDRITELEAQLAAIGAGGVEPLRKSPQQIGEPEREYLKSTMNQAIHEKIIAWDKHEAPAAQGDAVQVGSVPKAQFDDPKVQAVYAILCEDAEPPKGEHWEGFAARRIVDAFHGIKGDQPAC